MRRYVLAVVALWALVGSAWAVEHGELKRSGRVHVIALPSVDLAVVSGTYAPVPVSIEVPKGVEDAGVKGLTATKGSLERIVLDRYPPSPDGELRWVTFLVPVDVDAQELRFEIDSVMPITFARVVVGDPFSARSRLLGAFGEANALVGVKADEIIYPGEDMLGTIEAVQRVRIPAGFLGPETDAFDQMVSFGAGAFLPEENNVDTVMVRTQAIAAGGTTPVMLLKFSNRTVRPITVTRFRGKPLHFHVIAGESPHAESSGFVTIRADGRYQSSMRLVPVFSFIPVDKLGNVIGDPIVVDTGLIEVPGFPFWLASDGGRWTDRAPEGRLVTPASSNFFYEAAVNRFIHSNGPEGRKADGSFEQQLAACLKSSAEPVE